ncbi:MAG: hypothetical protein IPG79_03115 [Saprospiraceae bacterium]|nr:hypothetical protein [Saprospiraceae bacterium]
MINFFLGGSNSGDLLYSGDIDDFCVWNKELSLDEILKIMQENPSDEGPLLNFLMAHYDMNNKEENIIIDKSPYQQSAQFEEKVNRKRFSVSEIFKGYSQTMTRPKVSFIKGNYNFTSEAGISTDSIQNSFYKVTEYSVQDNSLIKGNVREFLQDRFSRFNKSGLRMHMVSHQYFPINSLNQERLRTNRK